MVVALSRSPLRHRHAFRRGLPGGRFDPPWRQAADGPRRRVVKKSYTSGTLKVTRDFYFSDQWQVLSEVVGGTVDKTYAWGLRYVDELLWRVDPASKRLYAMQDANFNCTAICDSSGAVAERYQFDPYGNRVVLSPSWSAISASAYDWTVAHQGLMLEVDIGLYNCRNRVYSPLLGVWLQRDPLGYADGVNLYEYVGSQPITFTDPSGEFFVIAICCTVCAALGIYKLISGWSSCANKPTLAEKIICGLLLIFPLDALSRLMICLQAANRKSGAGARRRAIAACLGGAVVNIVQLAACICCAWPILEPIIPTLPKPVPVPVPVPVPGPVFGTAVATCSRNSL